MFFSALTAALLIAAQVVSGQVTNDPPEGFELVDRRAALTLDQATAVKIQNDVRASKNLSLLLWDVQLTADAQAWANNLAQINKLVHSTSAQRPNEGENLAWA